MCNIRKARRLTLDLIVFRDDFERVLGFVEDYARKSNQTCVLTLSNWAAAVNTRKRTATITHLSRSSHENPP